MINLSHEEAILFRVLGDFFGKEKVIPRMSVKAVCGGSLPQIPPGFGINLAAMEGGIERWATENKCLFTIVDNSDNPCLVIEFFSGYENSVDIIELEHQTFLPTVLKAAGVRYVTMSPVEFSEIIDPDQKLDFFAFLNEKVNEQTES